VPDEIADHALPDHQLPVTEQLDQHRAEERIVGRAERHRRGRAQPRREVRQRDPPGGDRPGRGQQQMPAPLLQVIVQVQEAEFVTEWLGRIEHPGERVVRLHRRQRARLERKGATALRPDARPLGFAGTLGAVQHQNRRRPVRPALQPGKRLPIAGRRQEVLDPRSRALAKLEGQLVARVAHGPASG
jgi:hypothetical protein